MALSPDHSHWTAQKERTSAFWLKLMLGMAQRLPRQALIPFLYPITLFYFLISKTQKQASKHYLKQVLGRSPGFREVYRHFLWFAITILDRVYFMSGRIEAFDLHYANQQQWLADMERNPSQLFFGAHFGSLDAIRALSSDQFNIRIHIVLKVDQNQNLVNLLNQLNPKLAQSVIPYQGMQTVFEIHDALQNGRSVAMLKDRSVGEEVTVTVRFFDDHIAVPVSGFKLAKRFGIPVNVFFGRFEGKNRYHIQSETLHFDKEATIEEMAQIYMDKVADQCRLSPYNWFNFFPYWLPEKESDASQ